MKAFVIKGKARLTASNPKMKPYRQEVSQTAMVECRGMMFGKHQPVFLKVAFYFERPSSGTKRVYPAVKPDLDKLLRLVNDALTGIAYLDDGQVVKATAEKYYGTPERTEIEVTQIGGETA
jgi:Holliday junction resolvase RusA-like endonuclease